MSTYRNERYITKFVRSPLALTAEKRDEIFFALCNRVKGHRISDEEIAVFMNAAEERRSRYQAFFDEDDEEPAEPLVRFAADAQGRPEPRADGTVAVVPVLGSIAYRGSSMEFSSGGTSATFVGRLFDRAIADAGVKSVLLDIDSPGGTVDGIPELAARIFAARKVKPVVAIANSMAASAAYYLASQAAELVMIPSGYVGSIGVYSLFEDWSAYLEKEGIKINAISYGDNKLEGAPWEPMSDESRAFFKSEVDDIGRAFDAAVARGRGVTAADVRKNFGQGRVFRGKEALELGMVDRLDSFDGTLARMLKAKPGAPTAARATVTIGGGQFAESLVELRAETERFEATVRAAADGLDAAAAAAGLAADVEVSVNLRKTSALDAQLREPDAVEAIEVEERALADAEAQRQADLDAVDAALAIAERS